VTDHPPCIAVHCQLLAVVNKSQEVEDIEDGRKAVLAGHNGCVGKMTAHLCDDGAGAKEEWCPAGVRGWRDQDLP
jgi:hypothetical protein